MECLVEQIIDSLRRIDFAHAIRDGKHDPRRADPSSPYFDPLKAAVLHHRKGQLDEAYWLVFLATHFGKHGKSGWRLLRDVYGGLANTPAWTWARVSADLRQFRNWFRENEATLRGGDGVARGFSNHRKYLSLKSNSHAGVVAIIESYVDWIKPPRTHHELIHSLHKMVGQDPRAVFGEMYRTMNVKQFGRLGKFDYLTMLGKLGIAPIDPDSAYLADKASGPLAGARLLFDGAAASKTPARDLDRFLVELDGVLGVGMQVLEDALCNWQKSPQRYKHFTG